MTVIADTGTQRREVVVIGGGQAGLAAGYFLAQQNRRFTILEAAGEPASAWRSRWDSLRLFTSVQYDSLPGLDFPGDPDSYPGRDDVIAYLTDYARRFELPIEFNSRVQAVRARDDGGFLVELADRTYDTDLGALAAMGLVSGAVLGLAQGLALARHGDIGLAVAWGASMPLLVALGWSATSVTGISVEDQFTVFGAAGAVVFTLLSGVVLAYFAAPALQHASQSSRTSPPKEMP